MSDKPWVDFRLLKEQVTLEMALDHYQINWLRNKGSELVGRCPIHQGEGERAFRVNLEKGAFNCFSCHKHGNVIDFVAAMEGISIREAALKLAGWFGVETGYKAGETPEAKPRKKARPDAKQDKPVKTAPPAVVNPPLKFSLRVDPDHQYGLDRGLLPETLEHFGAGLCMSKGTFSGRFVFPLHNEQGDLVGYAGRSIDDAEPKYLFPAGEKGFYKSHLLFNLHRLIGQLEPDQPVIVVEGFFDCMKVHLAGFPCVAILGSWLSDEQAELLISHFDRVLLLLDGDDAGRQGTEDAVVKLASHLWVTALSLPDGVQPDQMTPEDLQNLLGGRIV